MKGDTTQMIIGDIHDLEGFNSQKKLVSLSLVNEVRDLKASLQKLIKAARRVVETYEYDTDECARMHKNGPCKRCKAIIDLRTALAETNK